MCGIVGIVKWRGEPVRREELERLNRALFHRGPDDEGYFIEECVGLAMRRLSIIDISGGRQPMISPDGNLVIVFNGEIYNYREVREELRALGHRFSTSSDTEVILAGYRQWGPEVLSRMNGMWGMAVYDRRKKELFLSRDRLGKKQIYYAANDKYMVFGSEMKVPMLYDPENRRLRISALPEFLTYGYIGSPETALEKVKLLPEATWAKVALDGRLHIRKYWDIAAFDGAGPSPRSEDDAAEEVYSLLTDAVNLRLVADVPISVMLSSGLDSSSCAYILAKELGAHLKTFSLGYDDEDFDESHDAGELAKKFDMPWERDFVTGDDVAKAFPEFIAHCDSLQSNTGQLVYFFVNRMIHEAGFKVAINGSGGDELFAGYRTYQANTLFKYYRLLPSFAKKPLWRAAQALPTKMGRVSTDYMLKKFTECPYDSPLKAHAYWRTMFSRDGLREVLAPAVWEKAPSFTRIYDVAFEEIGPVSEKINGLLCADLKAWLIPMLPWVDNMSMAHSVELRLPFLDYRLVQRALSFPERFLFDGWKLKKIMKRFLKGRLPDEVLYRNKRGTHLPVSRWLNKELAEIRDYYLSGDTLNREGLFNMNAVRRLVEEHREKKVDNTFKIWGLMVLCSWKEHNGVSL
jgi:asparagine synthase (glutamine-hydrolysing)